MRNVSDFTHFVLSNSNKISQLQFMLNGIILGNPDVLDHVFDQENMARYSQHLKWVSGPASAEQIVADPDILSEVEVIVGTWGMPTFGREVLDAAPKLKAIFYAAGSVRYFTPDEFWNRNIVLSSGYAANAVPVAEFTIAQLILGLKQALYMERIVQKGRDWQNAQANTSGIKGLYRSTIGLVSYGAIARLVRQLLKAYEVNVLVYDPFLGKAEAKQDHVTPVSLEEIFKRCDAVSIHTPHLPETENLITREHITSMPEYGVFINTARGAVIDEPGMIQALGERPDIQAMIDVTYPEPPESNSPLYDLPNLFMTPHIAGSMGRERARLGAFMADELDRFVLGQPLKWQVTQEAMRRMA